VIEKPREEHVGASKGPRSWSPPSDATVQPNQDVMPASEGATSGGQLPERCDRHATRGGELAMPGGPGSVRGRQPIRQARRVTLQARQATLQARQTTLQACRATLQARQVTLPARQVTLRMHQTTP